jgi:hypothetical protein
MIELITHPITLSVLLLMGGVAVARWFKARQVLKKAKMLLRRKAFRKSMDKSDWGFK